MRDCMRGSPIEKGLPVDKKGNKVKILHTMIDPEWLEDHPENDTPLRIQELKGDLVEEGNEGEEGEDEYDDMYGDLPQEEMAEPWNEHEGLWHISANSDEEM